MHTRKVTKQTIEEPCSILALLENALEHLIAGSFLSVSLLVGGAENDLDGFRVERGKQELWKLVKSKGMQWCGKRRPKIKTFDEGNTLNA